MGQIHGQLSRMWLSLYNQKTSRMDEQEDGDNRPSEMSQPAPSFPTKARFGAWDPMNVVEADQQERGLCDTTAHVHGRDAPQ